MARGVTGLTTLKLNGNGDRIDARFLGNIISYPYTILYSYHDPLALSTFPSLFHSYAT